jgi:hypothetical protein
LVLRTFAFIANLNCLLDPRCGQLEEIFAKPRTSNSWPGRRLHSNAQLPREGFTDALVGFRRVLLNLKQLAWQRLSKC